jgi:glutathione S-transferase
MVKGGLKDMVKKSSMHLTSTLPRGSPPCRTAPRVVDFGSGGEPMKLYDSNRAPSPRRVRIFLAEKGIKVDLVPVDLTKFEQFSDPFTALNPMQRVPVLVLDDGTVISETMAISRYFEALQPEPNLLGRDAREIALIEMWNRRVEFNFYWPVSQAFRHLHPAMAEREKPQVADWGEANKPKVVEFARLLDGELAKRSHVAGDRFTVADITAFVTVDFMKPAKIELPAELANVRRWHAAIAARPSSSA